MGGKAVGVTYRVNGAIRSYPLLHSNKALLLLTALTKRLAFDKAPRRIFTEPDQDSDPARAMPRKAGMTSLF
jgi:hypothetical protein